MSGRSFWAFHRKMDYFHGTRFLDTLADWERGRPPPHSVPSHYLPRTAALLRRLGDPQLSFKSVIVGGTNGKGTVSSLLADLLEEAGCRTGLYTSPHLHSQRERIQVSRRLLSKDDWADGMTRLYDATRGFESEAVGEFTKFEALTVLAALLFADAGVEFGVFEVGLGGRYDATNAWDSQLAVLTPIGLDHTGVLGSDVEAIATDKLHITRRGQPLLTTAEQPLEAMATIRRFCSDRGVPLYVAGPLSVETVDGGEAAGMPSAEASYAWNPSPSPERSCTFVENARLAVAAAGHLVGARLTAAQTRRAVGAHWWPGRFERASTQPLVLLDGAHNPAAAVALVDDLGSLAPRWVFVVGISSGHDGAAVLQALRPLAQEMILTSSAHPRAIDPEELPLAGVAPGRRIAACNQAFEAAVKSAGTGGHVCVTGSLALVARAREYFQLPFEREGISEEVALESLACLAMACERLGLEHQRVSANGNVLRVFADGKPVYFLRNKHPFNDYVAARLAEDKGYQYELFADADLPVPFTLQVFNPYADDRFDRYKTHGSVGEMVKEVEGQLSYPVLIKKYRSSVSQGVYVESDGAAVARRLQDLFENSGFLDNTILIQSFVEGPEYRLVASEEELLLVYEKRSEAPEGTVSEDPNPLHHASGQAVKVDDVELLRSLGELTAQVAAIIRLGFFAIDVIHGKEGFAILELNPNPFCYFYNRCNGREDFTVIYQGLLEKYLL